MPQAKKQKTAPAPVVAMTSQADLTGLSPAPLDNFEQALQNETKATEEIMQAAVAGSQNVFFGNRLCPFAQRVFWMATERGAMGGFTYAHVDLSMGGVPIEKSSGGGTYKRDINPGGTVPCIWYEGKPVRGSVTCALFMDELHRGSGDMPALIPEGGAMAAAIVRNGVDLVESLVGLLYGLLSTRDPSEQAVLKAKLTEAVAKLEAHYIDNAQAGGPYLLGERISLAEVCLTPLVYRFAATLPFYREFSAFEHAPRVQAAAAAAASRPAFQETKPANQLVCDYQNDFANGQRAKPLPCGSVHA